MDNKKKLSRSSIIYRLSFRYFIKNNRRCFAFVCRKKIILYTLINYIKCLFKEATLNNFISEAILDIQILFL